MRRRASSFRPMMSSFGCVLLATVVTGLDSPARAECILQPNQQAPEGTHWSLHTDRVKNRRCWILVDSNGHDISAPEEESAVSNAVSSLKSFVGRFTGGSTNPPSQEPAAGSTRKPQPRAAPVSGAADHPVRTEQKGEARQAKHEMTPGERDALFEEFLRWHESQRISGAGKSPAPR